MNQSIYTEYANLTPDHVAWLDGCGAERENLSYNEKNRYVCFNSGNTKLWFIEMGHSMFMRYTHIHTGSEFCQRVAEILGIDKPVFASDLKDKLVKKLEMHDRMERPLPEDKGLVIEVNLLSEEDKKFLTDCDSTFYIVIREATRLGYAVSFWAEKMAGHARIDFYRHEGLRITTDPNEFMRYVAAKTGKEWKPKGDEFIESFEPNDEEINKGIENAIKQSDKDDWKIWDYPHRTYRVLDSLDGIPFDTRIPLSEWIPPFGVDLIFISDADWYRGIVHAMDQRFIYLLVKGEEEECIVPLDGHWMRIV